MTTAQPRSSNRRVSRTSESVTATPRRRTRTQAVQAPPRRARATAPIRTPARTSAARATAARTATARTARARSAEAREAEVREAEAREIEARTAEHKAAEVEGEVVERARGEPGLVYWSKVPLVPIVRVPVLRPTALLAPPRRAARTARAMLPSATRGVYYGGLGALAVAGVLEWPVAAVVGVGVWLASRSGQAR
jgi:hypothetical protein